jgi:hypothetical protein
LNRSNIVYLIVGALVIVVAVLGYELYQDRKQPEGVRIDVGPKGLSSEKKWCALTSSPPGLTRWSMLTLRGCMDCRVI